MHDLNKITTQVSKNILITTSKALEAKAQVWFIHGFGDSGKTYSEVFESDLAHNYDLYVVDMPGFGSSPRNSSVTSIKDQASLLKEIIQETSDLPVVIVAHSIGGLVGTWLCQLLGSKVKYYFNIEGNLTEADSYFSSKPLGYETPEAFATDFTHEIFNQAITEERFKRYYASVVWANPQAMHDWATSSQHFVKDNLCGQEFQQLMCPKVYIWGDKDTPQETQQFIHQNQLPHEYFEGVGHWHMHENPAFYEYVQKVLQES